MTSKQTNNKKRTKKEKTKQTDKQTNKTKYKKQTQNHQQNLKYCIIQNESYLLLCTECSVRLMLPNSFQVLLIQKVSAIKVLQKRKKKQQCIQHSTFVKDVRL